MKSISNAFNRAGQRVQLAGVFLFLVAGYLFPKATRLATRRRAGPSTGGAPVPAPATVEGRGKGGTHGFIVGGSIAITLLSFASGCFAGALVDRPTTYQQRAFIKVNYADTLLGVQAMFAVRACSAEDEPAPRHAGRIPEPPASLPFIDEEMSAEKHDVVVRVFDVDGREIASHEGATDVCGFARLAAAFVAKAGGRAAEGAR